MPLTHRDSAAPRRTSITAAAVLLATLATLTFSASASAQAAGELSRGSSGSAVKALQRALRLTADGEYGSQTVRAVKRLERREGLPVDGAADAAVLAALELDVAEDSDPAGGSSSGGTTFDEGTTDTEGADEVEDTDISPSVRAQLEKIAKCESGGDPRAIGGGGKFRGKYQFDLQTWKTVGGTGDPAKASEAEQDRRAAKLLAKRGTAPWPNCA